MGYENRPRTTSGVLLEYGKNLLPSTILHSFRVPEIRAEDQQLAARMLTGDRSRRTRFPMAAMLAARAGQFICSG